MMTKLPLTGDGVEVTKGLLVWGWIGIKLFQAEVKEWIWYSFFERYEIRTDELGQGPASEYYVDKIKAIGARLRQLDEDRNILVRMLDEEIKKEVNRELKTEK